MNILINLGIPCLDTVLANAACSFEYLRTSCSNCIVVHLRDLMCWLCINDVLVFDLFIGTVNTVT